MKKMIVPLMLGFGITMAVLIGQRMSTDAMAVVVGVAVGVTASVPTSLFLVALLRKERSTAAWPPELPPGYQQQPNVIVVNPGDLGSGRNGQTHVPLPPPELQFDGGMRRLRVVGDDDEWS